MINEPLLGRRRIIRFFNKDWYFRI